MMDRLAVGVGRIRGFLLLRFVIVLCLAAAATSASAHFKLNLNIRIFHVEHRADGADVYLRLPMPYLVAALLGPEEADGTRKPAPYTTNEMEDGELMHRVDVQQLLDDARPLGQLAADGHNFISEDVRLVPEVALVRVYSGNDQPPFSTLDEAIRAFTNDQRALEPAPYVGDSVVDVLLQFRTGTAIATYELSGNLDPGLPGQEETANLLLDYDRRVQDQTEGQEQGPRVHRIRGLMLEPVMIDRSIWSAAKSFIAEGVRHILGGYDHVLFVACLVLGALTFIGLAWRVTGFTIGHSITLSLGFFGFTPSANWFIPLVETGIALSIIYAAVYAISSYSGSSAAIADAGSVTTPVGQSPATKQAGSQLTSFFITVTIGMLHGLGFSFVLKEILGVTSSNIWVSLLSFNVGVELGQLAIVMLIWPMLWLAGKLRPGWNEALRWAIALPCIAIASVWTGQRVILLLSALQSA